MLARFGAPPAAVGSARGRYPRFNFHMLAAIAACALSLVGCMPQSVPLAVADPADPGANVAGVRYRSTIAPYASLRPSTPSRDTSRDTWRERNDGVAPSSRPDR
jgi:hypothetical protein